MEWQACALWRSCSSILPIPGSDLQGVLGYRDIADTQAMIDAATQYHHAVVIGGGLLGLEAANGLMKRGMQVTVVHVGDWLMERQLDESAASGSFATKTSGCSKAAPCTCSTTRKASCASKACCSPAIPLRAHGWPNC